MRTIAGVIGVLALLAAGSNARAGEPKLLNPSFESPKVVGESMGTEAESWFYFSSTEQRKMGLTTAKRRNGTQAVVMEALDAADTYQGIAQKFPAEPGKRYEFSVFVINDAAEPIVGEAYGQVSLEWQDANGVEITRNWGPTWNFQLTPLRWERFSIAAEAPEGASVGVAVVTFFTKDAKGQGRFYLDDAEVKEVVPGK